MSRIIVKHLPKNIKEKELRETFKTSGNITDLKLVNKDGVFSGYSFIGFETPQQAQQAISKLNNTYCHSMRITVEPAIDLNDRNRPTAWRKRKQEWKDEEQRDNDVEQKKEDHIKLRIKLSELRRVREDTSKTNSLLEKYKNDPKFVDYIRMTTGDTITLDKLKAKEEEKKKAEVGLNNSENEEKEENDNNNDNCQKLSDTKDVSDAKFWSMVMSQSSQSKPQTPAHKKDWKKLHTIRLRITKFPKSKDKSKKAKKKIGLTKQEVKDFFKPLQIKSFRQNSKNRFEYFIGFESESIVKSALRKDGSYIQGVRARVNALSTPAGGDTAPVQHKQGVTPWAEAEARLERAESVAESGKLFLRNLSYLVTEEKIKEKFAEYGMCEIELPVCKHTRRLKGFATISFMSPQAALKAMNEQDGTELMGRLMHVLPALSDEQVELQKGPRSSFKKQQEEDQKANCAVGHDWNTLFVSSEAVVDIMAKKYHKTKEQILDSDQAQSAAVTLALGETQIVHETRRFLEEHGVSVDAFSDPTVSRSDTILLVKNLPAGTKATDVAEMFCKWGELGRVVLPPSGTTAIVEYLSSTEAKKALRNMNFKKFGSQPLYLEKAPVKCFDQEYKKPESAEEDSDEEEQDGAEKRKREEEDIEEGDVATVKKAKKEVAPEAHTTIYVQNLPKETTEEEIMTHFSTAGKVHSVVLAKKGEQSRGYGFVQYIKQKHARNALISLDDSTLGGRNLALKLSEKILTSSVKTSRQMHDYGEAKSAKISVKNVPFQATKSEVEQLFRAFGGLKRVFLQKHHSGQFNNGGYGFVEFTNLDDAKRVLDTLGMSTHLMGRRLVLQWAKEDETVEELRQKTAQKQDIVQALGISNKKMRHAMQDAAENKQQQED